MREICFKEKKLFEINWQRRRLYLFILYVLNTKGKISNNDYNRNITTTLLYFKTTSNEYYKFICIVISNV